jgi:hypothetical protein
VINPDTKALTVQFEVENRDGRLLIGQSGTALLYTRNQVRVPAVPKDAVLMEAGRPYVFVQMGGESFARRFVEIAAREGDLVGLKSGVKPGERVVTRGAYDVQLASAAKGLPPKATCTDMKRLIQWSIDHHWLVIGLSCCCSPPASGRRCADADRRVPRS